MRPLGPILSKSALLTRCQGANQSAAAAGVESIQGTATYAERREELRLLVSFSDCKWICDTLWKHFFTVIAPSVEMSKINSEGMDGPDFERFVESIDLRKLTNKQHILEESILYARLAALMVEADLQERQHTSNIFTFDSLSGES